MRGYNVLFNALLPAIQNNDKPVPPCVNPMPRWGQFQSLLCKMQKTSACLKAALKNKVFFVYSDTLLFNFTPFLGGEGSQRRFRCTVVCVEVCLNTWSRRWAMRGSCQNTKSLSVRVCALFHSAVSELEIERWKPFCFFFLWGMCVFVCVCSCPNSFSSSIPPQGSFHKEITWQCVSVCPQPFC